MSDSEEAASIPKADCYSAGERTMMVWTQQVRGRLLAPLLSLLIRCGVTPDHLTLLSLLAGVSFWPLYVLAGPEWMRSAALAMLAMHVLLDGVDGPLARRMGVDSRRGSFTDSLSDQIVVTLVTAALMQAGQISPACGGIYIFLYASVVALAMVRNAMEIPYSWLVRPRFFVYGYLVFEMFLLPASFAGSIEVLLWLFIILLAIKLLTGFLKVRKKM